MIYYKKKSWIKKIKIINSRGFLKLIGRCAFLIIILIFISYFSILILINKFANEKNIETIINNFLLKNSEITFDSKNLKVTPSLRLDIAFKADEMEFKYKNERKIVELNNPYIELNFLTMFLGYLDLDKIKAKKVVFYTNFTKNKHYSAFYYINPDNFLLNSKLELRNIRIFIDEFCLNLFDENIKKSFNIKTYNTKLFLNSPVHNSRLLTKGSIYSNEKMINIDFDISFKTKENIFKNYKTIIDKLNYNPLADIQKYDFKSDIEAKLKIIPLEKRWDIEGKISLLDYSFKVSNILIPKNNLLLIFKGDKIITEGNFNFIKNQFIKIKSVISLSKNKYIEAKILSNEINLADLTPVLNAFYKGNNYEIKGTLKADLYLKSNFKKIVSTGLLTIEDGSFIDKKTGLKIEKINSNISFKDNKINILNTSAFFDSAKFYIKGVINSDTKADIQINSDLIDISQIINSIKPIPDYIIKGFLKINADIKGKISNPTVKTNSKLENLKVINKKDNIIFNSKEIFLNLNPDKKTINEGDLTLLNSEIVINNNSVKFDKMKLNLNDNLIIINKTPVNLKDISLNLEGNIKIKTKEAILNIDGDLKADNKFIKLNENKKLFSNLTIKDNKIFINNLNIPDTLNAKGTINDIFDKNPILDIKINIIKKVFIKLKTIDSFFNIQGNISIEGNIKKPSINGDLTIDNFKNDKFNLFIESIILNIKNSLFYINSAGLKIQDNDFDVVAEGKYENDILIFNYLNFISNHINIDKLKDFKNAQDIKNIKFEIKNLKGNIALLDIAGLQLNDVQTEGKIKDDILNIENLRASIFQGLIKGTLNIDLKTDKTKADLILKEISIRHLTSQIKNLSIAISGKLSALLRIEFQGYDFYDILKTSKGYVKFNIDNGELAQFAKLERYLQAGNILSQSILKLSLNQTLSALTKQNTGDFKTIEGTVKLNNSTADVQYIKTIGTNMSTYITGFFDLLTEEADIRVLGRIPLNIVNVLGNFGKYSLDDSVSKMDEDTKGVIKALTNSPVEKRFSIKLDDEEINKIPPLAYRDENTITREFIVYIKGQIKNINSVKYFKWKSNE